ncbi:MAG: hypothetical protein WB817_17475 [Terriglobales bacterium]
MAEVEKPKAPPESSPQSEEREELLRAASDPSLNADQSLALLKRSDLPSEVIEQIARNRFLLTHRKVKMAIASHSHTPRHVSLPLIRQLYTFDLMKIVLSSGVAADVKANAEQVLVARLKTITAGERLTMARRASGRVAAALLLDSDERIMRTALDNPRLAEAQVVQAVLKTGAQALVEATSHHARWSFRRDVQVALLRTEHLSLASALSFARGIPHSHLREILQDSRLPMEIRSQLPHEVSGKTAAAVDATR